MSGIIHDNGSDLTRDQLRVMREQANKQEKIIGRIFWNNKGRLITPSQIQKYIEKQGYHWPITSTRRAINTLTEGYTPAVLEKTQEKRLGPHSRPEHCWRWREPRPADAQQVSMFEAPALKDNGYSKPY